MQEINKDSPSAEWISAIRQRFTVEKEIDHILTRKLERRSGPGYSPITLASLVQSVESLLRTEIGDTFEIKDTRWLSGGASKLQMAFTLEWNRPGAGFENTAMVLRMEPAESIVETSRLREFQLLKACEAVVPVPSVFWCDAQARHLPYPALIYGFAPGVTKPSNASSGVSGLATHLPELVRNRLAPQFVANLAAIHLHDYRNADLSAFDVPRIGTTQCAEWGIDHWDRIWEEDSDEDIPLMRVVSAWLRRNMPVLDRASIVHSDYRTGNFLFTEHDLKISAWLDWELGRIGDRHQDLAWTTNRAFGHLDQDGKTFLVCGLMPEAQFFEQYEKASGMPVSARTVHWYKIYNSYSIAVLTLATGYRIARNGKTHQDVLVTWLIGIGYMILEEVRTLIAMEN
ncbi:phosphotransferase family protein [Paraburkholderia madseniana]|uniref:phosphotransferase family protein n=1 Tax=Paraburkholderia madseniana TaxID=2599607 RepID=UPI0038BCF811